MPDNKPQSAGCKQTAIKTPLAGERFSVEGGCHTDSWWSPILFDFLNLFLAALMILGLIPLFLILAIVIKSREPKAPVLYRGVRLGLNKREFVMYKFRTLPLNAQQVIGGALLSRRHGMLTPMTRFLRDTRLDELPQLFNILKRDMNFIGPRPERPEIYEKLCRQIPDYDTRFCARPGLIGYSQVYTPYSAPKRLRALIDNKFVSNQRHPLWELRVISFTMLSLGRRALRKLFASTRIAIETRILSMYKEKRLLERIRPEKALALIYTETGTQIASTPLLDINETHFKIFCDADIAEEIPDLRLEIEANRGNGRKYKKAACSGKVLKKFPLPGDQSKFVYVIEYIPKTPLNQYLIDQYFLCKSIA